MTDHQVNAQEGGPDEKLIGHDQHIVQGLCNLAAEQALPTLRDLLEDSAAEIEVLRQKVRQSDRIRQMMRELLKEIGDDS